MWVVERNSASVTESEVDSEDGDGSEAKGHDGCGRVKKPSLGLHGIHLA